MSAKGGFWARNRFLFWRLPRFYALLKKKKKSVDSPEEGMKLWLSFFTQQRKEWEWSQLWKGKTDWIMRPKFWRAGRIRGLEMCDVLIVLSYSERAPSIPCERTNIKLQDITIFDFYIIYHKQVIRKFLMAMPRRRHSFWENWEFLKCCQRGSRITLKIYIPKPVTGSQPGTAEKPTVPQPGFMPLIMSFKSQGFA